MEFRIVRTFDICWTIASSKPIIRDGMVHMAAKVTPPEVALPELADAFRYLARQPILDTHGRIYAYELLFRVRPENAFRGDSDLATRTMLDNAVIFGLDKLTAGLPAFVNCTMESLTERLVNVLPPTMTVLEILETLEPTNNLIAACHELKAAGYRNRAGRFYLEAEVRTTCGVGRLHQGGFCPVRCGRAAGLVQANGQ
jgi:hypothetical protein